MRPLILFPAIVLASTTLPASAERLWIVPDHAPSIQAAIDQAEDGDIVRVRPGHYRERLSFQGRAIVVESLEGPNRTLIDGGLAGTVVRFDREEGPASVLRGFTILRGRHVRDAGGIHADHASPTIEGNLVISNHGGRHGHGISLLESRARVLGNRIEFNRSVPEAGSDSGGGGIGVYGGAPWIEGNRIRGNQVLGGSGGGIRLIDSQPVLRGNTIEANVAGLAGGGIAVLGSSGGRLEHNLVVGNRLSLAGIGGGVAVLRFGEAQPLTLAGNTVAANLADAGSAVHVEAGLATVELVNNILSANAGASALSCSGSGTVSVRHNLIDAGPWALHQACPPALDDGRNRGGDPGFEVGSWQLAPGSPAIDAALDGAATQKHDLAGAPRRVDGDGDGHARVDIGALERQGPRD
jgi:parallel beta-helix repeat protein